MGKPKAQKMIVRPSGKNEECITVIKGSRAKAKGLTKSQIKRIRIKETLNKSSLVEGEK